AAPRGRILDRNGNVLADSGPAWRVRIDRRIPAARRADLLRRLSPVLGIPVSDLTARMKDPSVARAAPATLLDDAPDEVVLALRERAGEFPGIEVDSHPIRRYPHGSLAAHVLGVLGGAPGPGRAGRPGASGVEAACDSVLAGRPGEERIEVDSAGRPVRTLSGSAAVPGHDVRLTVDLGVQAAAEQALAEGMAAARAGVPGAGGTAAPGGAVVAVDVRDGSIVALASAPTFDPAALAGRIPTAVWSALHDPAAHAPLTDRALQGLYAPGSTFKPVTALAGLRAGLITPATVVDDRGTYVLAGRTLRNAQNEAHGKVDLARALAVSSDVYFYGLGAKLYTGPPAGSPDGPIQDVAARLGFGRPTGIDIGPEAGGRLPGPSARRAAHERSPQASPDPRWYLGDNVNLAIGQGSLLVTPLQLADAYASLSTGLAPPTPHVLSAPCGEAAGVAARSGRAPAGFDAVALRAVQTGLLGAVGAKYGTASAAFAGFPLDRVPVEGKTGTAQVNGKADTSLFAAAAPANAPRYAVVAVVEEAGFGSAVAAPIVRRVLDALLDLPAAPAAGLTALGAGPAGHRSPAGHPPVAAHHGAGRR
ncbi:MAG TPA: penicillin-binding transpeptidase domain-containing protein, partial [Acidimicrobiia bacterium]|nr:penicillin-binding transpeptidase domain-containing protein [Acidimicrobiia bacterium]